MARVYKSDKPSTVLKNRKQVEKYLSKKILGNKNRSIGTELELFITDKKGQPISFDQVETILEHMQMQFLNAKLVKEKGRVVGVHIPHLGDVCLEPGGQVELSTKPCANMTELEKTNTALRASLEKSARVTDTVVLGTGHLPSFLKSEDMPRSRFHAYYAYCRKTYGDKAEDLINTMKSCNGLQVNFDTVGRKFYEVYQALMLVDVAESLSARTTRQKRLHDTYASLAPEQLTPLFNTLGSKNNADLISKITSRLLTLKVPFLPDPESDTGFVSTQDIFGHTPTVKELLDKGEMTTNLLDNVLSLQLTMPNIRRHGVVETRSPDSPATTKAVMETAKKYHRYAYDAKSRHALLEKFKGIEAGKLMACFQSRFDMSTRDLKAFDLGGGLSVNDLLSFFAKPEKPALGKKITP